MLAESTDSEQRAICLRVQVPTALARKTTYQNRDNWKNQEKCLFQDIARKQMELLLLLINHSKSVVAKKNMHSPVRQMAES